MATRPWFELDDRYRVVSPAEVWALAQKDRKAELAAKPKPAPLPPPPWYSEYVDGGVDAGVVGDRQWRGSPSPARLTTALRLNLEPGGTGLAQVSLILNSKFLRWWAL